MNWFSFDFCLFAAITYGDIVAVQPFGNSIDILELTGQDLIDVFEYNGKRAFGQKLINSLLQVSGLRITFNATKPIGQRVVLLETSYRHCESDTMKQYEPIDKTRTYHLVTYNYLINGGDGYNVLAKAKRNHV